MSTKKYLPRRDFLKHAMVAGTVAAPIMLHETAMAESAGQSTSTDRVRFAMIGVGMQGSGLLSNAITLSGITCVAAAELYDGRHTLARQITGNLELPVTRRYHEVLERKDVDCIVAAVPDHWHMRVVVDACSAGKDIYCEKPMSHAIRQGFAMVEAAQKNQRIVQIGSQRVSSMLCAKARDLYHSGAIGEIEMVELSLGRNSPTGAWEYPPPLDASAEVIDWETWLNDAPKIPFDKYRFARWRCWKEYGTGVAGDLMVHLLSGMLFTLGWNEAPRSATALGGIVRWKDGRNMPDLQTVLFDYHGVPVYVRLSLGAETPEMARFLGPKGVMEASGTELRIIAQSGTDTSPSYYASSFPQQMRAEYDATWYREHGPSWREPITDQTVYQGNDWDDVRPHLWTFFQAVKSRKPVAEDAVFGNHAAIACHMANESYFRGQTVYFDAETKTLRA
ncbi:MAG: Gfo/Idh/MocA family oxidoreductase [Acidobacteriaceae bacterium]|nr:Gfo/Idh/MocA family oxidoreductase [Acidobacteriaceae bacterium]MBV8571428.1 Gfo/Idh/MocA family oxidoreductase [Acidobacteriaceae bacterium]